MAVTRQLAASALWFGHRQLVCVRSGANQFDAVGLAVVRKSSVGALSSRRPPPILPSLARWVMRRQREAASPFGGHLLFMVRGQVEVTMEVCVWYSRWEKRLVAQQKDCIPGTINPSIPETELQQGTQLADSSSVVSSRAPSLVGIEAQPLTSTNTRATTCPIIPYFCNTFCHSGAIRSAGTTHMSPYQTTETKTRLYVILTLKTVLLMLGNKALLLASVVMFS